MNDSVRGLPDLQTLETYRDGYRMIREVSTDFDPVGIVTNEWERRERVTESMRNWVDLMPGLKYEAPSPEILAVELLAAVGDLLADPSLKPLLMDRIIERSALFERLHEQRLDEDDADDEDDF